MNDGDIDEYLLEPISSDKSFHEWEEVEGTANAEGGGDILIGESGKVCGRGAANDDGMGQFWVSW
jgi:hypothetical protein